MTEHTRLFFLRCFSVRRLRVSLAPALLAPVLVTLGLAIGGLDAGRVLRAQENPMSAPVYPVEDDEPEAAQKPPEPAPALPAPTSAERLKIVTAPLPPVRPWSASPPGNGGSAPRQAPAAPEEAGTPAPPPAPAASAAIPVDAPLPPRRPGAPVTSEPEPEAAPAEAATAEAAPPPVARVPTLGGPERDFPMSIEPDMRVAFAPPIAVPSTTEEIEAEEARAPEPVLVEKQTDAVDIACIRPEVMGILRTAGEHFGATPVITSGQRDRGRRGSYHRQCMAADFFIPGIERSRLAKYLRGQVGAGGVGTYCHTKSVHIDIGEPRNWYQCGRRFRFAQR